MSDPAAANPQSLSQDEVDALLDGMDGEAAAAAAASAAAAAAQPAEVDRGLGGDDHVLGRMPALEAIGERFARHARTGLGELIGRACEVAIGKLELRKYGAFVRELAVPSNLNIVSLEPLQGAGLIVCEPSLVFAVIDALFGGAGRFAARIEGREFSATERRVIARLLDVVTDAARKSWDGIQRIAFDCLRNEMQPQFANIASAEQRVVVSSFAFEIGGASGTLQFCIPLAALEPIRARLQAPQGAPPPPDPRWLALLKEQIQGAEVELVAELASAPASVAQLVALQPGDFVELDLEPLIQARVDGVPVLACRYGTRNGRYAIRVEQLLSTPEETHVD